MSDEWIPYGERQRLSRCALWDISSQYYCQQGLDAWRQIPYVITGSRVIAEVYSDLILALCKDLAPRLQGGPSISWNWEQDWDAWASTWPVCSRTN